MSEKQTSAQRELLDYQLANRSGVHSSYYADAAVLLLAVFDRVMDEPLFCPCCNTAWRRGCEPDCPVKAACDKGLAKDSTSFIEWDRNRPAHD